jgi:hypothetical protein
MQDDEKVRVFGKGQRERTVMLTAAPESIRLLRRHLKQNHLTSGSVFRGDPRYGGSSLPLEYSVVHYAWQKYCKQAGVEATIHQLRHSRASQLIQAGVPVTTVRKQLGHRNLQSTLLYAEVDQATIISFFEIRQALASAVHLIVGDAQLSTGKFRSKVKRISPTRSMTLSIKYRSANSGTLSDIPHRVDLSNFIHLFFRLFSGILLSEGS